MFLLDEPTTGIDAQSLEPVIAAIRAATRGATTILVEHDLGLVQALADEVCVLENGRFVQVGAPAELVAVPGPFRDLVEARARLVAQEASMTVESFPVPKVDAPPMKAMPAGAVGGLKIAPGSKAKAMAQ